MNLPGFTAEASLEKRTRNYRMGAPVETGVSSRAIVPQQLFELHPDIYDLGEDLVATPVLPLPPPSPNELIFALPIPLPYPRRYAIYVTSIPITDPRQYVFANPQPVPLP